MKQSDLFREYARVIDMCEGAEVHPYKCVKQRGLVGFHKTLEFTGSPEEYTFAIGICEGKPVFAGDVLYQVKTGNEQHIDDQCKINPVGFYEHLTWTKPDPYAELKKAHADGKVIQVNHVADGWITCTKPNWLSDVDAYRVKPEPVVTVKTRYIMRLAMATGDDHTVQCTWTDGVLINVEIVK